MEPLARLLRRNAHRWREAEPIAWFEPPSAAAVREATAEPARWRLWCQDFGAWRRLRGAGIAGEFAAFPAAATPSPAAILLTLPREKQRLRMLAHCAAAQLGPGGRLWVLGENQAGIRSSGRHLAEFFEQVTRVDSAGHAALLCAVGVRGGLTGEFDASAYRTQWRAETPFGAVSLCSWPGVFAHGSLDAGTALLLDGLAAIGPDAVPAGARVLDFGCGCGVIGASVLQWQPLARLTSLDASALACQSTECTLAANHLEATVLASDGFSELSGRFDLIVSNPPFHAGHRQDSRLSQGLLDEAGNFLAPGGQLILVANRHLPYRRWLQRRFGSVVEAAGDTRYHVLQATAPVSEAERARGLEPR